MDVGVRLDVFNDLALNSSRLVAYLHLPKIAALQNSENCDPPCGAPVPVCCRLGIPVLRSLSPMKVTLRRAPATPCSIRRSDHDNRRH